MESPFHDDTQNSAGEVASQESAKQAEGEVMSFQLQ